MSNRRRPQYTDPASASSERPVTTVTGPGDIVAIVPYLFGFDPTDSLVVIGLEGRRKRFGPCFRLDLAQSQCDREAEIDYVDELIRQLAFTTVVLAVFSDAPWLADPVAQGVLARLEGRGVVVHEAVRADGLRWWSYTCDNSRCCSPDGVPYDVETSRVAAEAVAAGMPRQPSRDSLRQHFEPDTDRQQTLAASIVDRPDPAGREELGVLLEVGLADPLSLDIDEQAQLVVGVQAITVRDSAWLLMSRENAGSHFELWSHLVRGAPDALMAPVGSLAAFAAWLMGSGVLASHAAERVLIVHPGYSMATLVLDALQQAMPPDLWDPGDLRCQAAEGLLQGRDGHAAG